MGNYKKLEQFAREERAAYHRDWRKRNPEKLREYNKRYWIKKAKARLEEEKGNRNDK
ncbi:hypothetical protein LJC04_03490 [Ruminococcaceae bacterium OttesenSCG-928-O06]|nr:hypothetical protein [Ruminococcaceae bacterium OttesenSCG-928-O06]